MVFSRMFSSNIRMGSYSGQVWPGWCHFPDFTNPTTRKWWKDQFTEYVNLGVKGFWNDMNEIATWGNMLPENIEMNFGLKSPYERSKFMVFRCPQYV
jgi:alpha-glucosidase